MSLSEHGEKTEQSGIGLKSTLLRYTSAKLLRSEWSLVLLATAVGFCLRWWWPAMRADLWYDEMYSYIIARQPFAEMVRTLYSGADANPPLYIVALHFWLKLCHSDFQIRLLSLISGTAAIPAMYFAARGIGGRRLAAMCSLLIAVSIPAIEYSSELRTYSMLLFFSLLSTGLAVRIFSANSKTHNSQLDYSKHQVSSTHSRLDDSKHENLRANSQLDDDSKHETSTYSQPVDSMPTHNTTSLTT